MSWDLFELLRPRRPAAVAAARARRPAPRFRPALEALEDRCVMDVGIQLNPVAGLSGFVNPLLLTNAGDGSNRLFVVEQRGRILVQQPSGGAPTVFLDVSATAANPAHRRVQSGGEQGLIGVTFHPQYETNGLFYVHHTRLGLTNTNDVVQYRVSTTNPNVADPDSQQLLLRVPQPFSNHNGGSIEFGPFDGLLYIAKGDGGSGNDPGNRAQDPNELLGKVLRIDVNRDDFPSDPNRNYGIPPDNPFVGVPGADEVFALGLRNPFRFSFDRGTGLLYAGDVGQAAREEIDIVTMGGNYGWRPFEGNIATPGINTAEGNAVLPFAIFPITDLERGEARSITGGYVYRGTQGSLPDGAYLFGDFLSRQVFLFQNGARTTLLDNAGFNISSFGEDEAGELYVVGYNNGIVYRVASTSANLPPVVSALANQTVPSGQDTLTVDVSATDPNNDAVFFSATAQSLALVLDTQLGLRTDGDLREAWFGAGARWLLDRNNNFHFILPDGRFFRWDGNPSATGTLVGIPGATYFARIELLYNAQEAFNLDLGRGFRTDNGELYENFYGLGERWLLDRNNNFHFILPNGDLFFWDGNDSPTGTLVARLGPSYHELIRLLHEGDQGQALASFQFFDNSLLIDRDDGFVAAVVFTVLAGDGELTGRRTFTVTVTA